MTHPPDDPARPRGFWGSKASFVAIAFLVIAAFLLLSEHRAHALGLLPFLLLLACPLLHRFMHGGHGSHQGHGGHGGGRSGRTPPQPEGE